ncbi:MAG: undecaprenyldiphospho-muramoylpentapeptide beta-N-acetylglucosaminyltransferase [Elioraea sp.]|nr:undecaprenyldiphospho-muramoylpentapeptide beta-N-acetylglucosaminyltransferase [Elioraea sp.]
MRGARMRPIAIAAGGTGGHLYPAIATAAALAERDERVVLLTDRRTAERSAAAFGAAEIHVIRGQGIAGRGLARMPRAFASLALGVIEARGILERLAPAAIVAFGSYPSVAPVLASRALARRDRPRVVLHEQNAVLGRANRLLARFADLLALSFAETMGLPARTRTALIGTPIRPEIAELAGQAYVAPAAGGPVRLLVLGGSQGARVFADLIPDALALLPHAMRERLVLTMQCRAEDVARTEERLGRLGLTFRLAPFFDDIALVFAQAHLVLCRAGASTVAELACAGRPAILVPYPHATDDHQSANARALVAAGAAEAFVESALTPPVLAEHLTALIADPARLQAMAQAARALARPQAARDLAEAVLALAPTETH